MAEAAQSDEVVKGIVGMRGSGAISIDMMNVQTLAPLGFSPTKLTLISIALQGFSAIAIISTVVL